METSLAIAQAGELEPSRPLFKRAADSGDHSIPAPTAGSAEQADMPPMAAFGSFALIPTCA